VLEHTFGLAGFRPGQADVVAAAEADVDVLFVAPTGSGKSIAYWVPGIARGGLTLVVSPLIALMVDQVARLNQLGVPAECLHSQVSAGARADATARAAAGELRFLYLAPERIGAPGFIDTLRRLDVDRFVVDEAHCISSWGHDFRPEYRRLAEAIEACGRPPVGAFTATATPRVRSDIAASLGLRDPVERVTGFVRDNLTMSVLLCGSSADKRTALLSRIRPGAGRALVYCGSRKSTDEIATLLRDSGLAAAPYHGRLEGGERQDVYEDFAAGRVRVIVATSAFGMGVDFPDIRQVIHYDFPGSLEEYYQQAGRAGRGGAPSQCILLYRGADRQLQEFFIEQAYPERDTVRAVYRELLREGGDAIADWAQRGITDSEARAGLDLLRRADVIQPDGSIHRLSGAPVDFDEQARLKEHAYARLGQVMEYARSRACRHARIADYFGEKGVPRTCEACDNCLDPRAVRTEVVDPTRVAAMLACVARFDSHLGAARIASILRGTTDAWTATKPWVSELAFFGGLRDWELVRIRGLLDRLIELGCIARGHGEKPTLRLTVTGRAILRGESGLEVAVEVEATATAPGPRRRPHADGSPPAALNDDAVARFDLLRRWRLETARRDAVPPFVIFHDTTLTEIARRSVGSMSSLAAVPGVGPAKLKRYGEAVLALLEAARRSSPDTDRQEYSSASVT
jgi:ATP-dependent DNA helicase RecQ